MWMCVETVFASLGVARMTMAHVDMHGVQHMLANSIRILWYTTGRLYVQGSDIC